MHDIKRDFRAHNAYGEINVTIDNNTVISWWKGLNEYYQQRQLIFMSSWLVPGAGLSTLHALTSSITTEGTLRCTATLQGAVLKSDFEDPRQLHSSSCIAWLLAFCSSSAGDAYSHCQSVLNQERTPQQSFSSDMIFCQKVFVLLSKIIVPSVYQPLFMEFTF